MWFFSLRNRGWSWVHHTCFTIKWIFWITIMMSVLIDNNGDGDRFPCLHSFEILTWCGKEFMVFLQHLKRLTAPTRLWLCWGTVGICILNYKVQTISNINFRSFSASLACGCKLKILRFSLPEQTNACVSGTCESWLSGTNLTSFNLRMRRASLHAVGSETASASNLHPTVKLLLFLRPLWDVHLSEFWFYTVQ